MSKQRINQEARKKRINCREALDIETNPKARSKREIENQEKLTDRRERRKHAKEIREKVKQSRKELVERKKAEGILLPPQSGVSNAKSPYKTIEDQQAAHEEVVAAQFSTYLAMLPPLLIKFSKIPDPRNPGKVKHKVTVLIIYGIVMFLFNIKSLRDANQVMSGATFFENLKMLIPEFETMPHSGTLSRLLEKIDVTEIESAHIDLIRKLIRKKKFCRYLISKCYPIAIDGTQKLVRKGDNWPEEWLERVFKTKDGEEIQRYIYVLEANLVFFNGMSLPLLTEFLSYSDDGADDNKQDCELKAFHRLAEKLHDYFPRLPIMVLLDGLYPTGPLMQSIQDYRWQYMIVLPSKCLTKTWHAAKARQELGITGELTGNKNHVWNGRRQHFQWSNNISYFFGDNKTELKVNLVTCEEEYLELDDKSGEIVVKKAFHAWLSSSPLNSDNVHERCNLGARYRWAIENSFQTEKCGGYKYSHMFSNNWNATKGFHYIMRLAHLLNDIAIHTKRVAELVHKKGVRAFLASVREICAAPWLRPERIKELLSHPFQFQFL